MFFGLLPLFALAERGPGGEYIKII